MLPAVVEIAVLPAKPVADFAGVKKFGKVWDHEEGAVRNWNCRDGVCPHYADPRIPRLHGNKDRGDRES